MLQADGEPKLIDFGLSADIGEDKSQLNSMVGSKMFMAPEIIGRTSHS